MTSVEAYENYVKIQKSLFAHVAILPLADVYYLFTHIKDVFPN